MFLRIRMSLCVRTTISARGDRCLRIYGAKDFTPLMEEHQLACRDHISKQKYEPRVRDCVRKRLTEATDSMYSLLIQDVLRVWTNDAGHTVWQLNRALIYVVHQVAIPRSTANHNTIGNRVTCARGTPEINRTCVPELANRDRSICLARWHQMYGSLVLSPHVAAGWLSNVLRPFNLRALHHLASNPRDVGRRRDVPPKICTYVRPFRSIEFENVRLVTSLLASWKTLLPTRPRVN